MISELVALAENLRLQGKTPLSHDALKTELVGIDCVIKENGDFLGFVCFEKLPTLAEALSSKKGKARLLLDKAEEVLGVKVNEGAKEGPDRKHKQFMSKLSEFADCQDLRPILAFYNGNGIDAARSAFNEQVPEKKRSDNIAFRISNEDTRVHEKPDVLNALIAAYDLKAAASAGTKKCAVCGTSKYPVGDIPHGMVKRVPKGKPSGCALISYNKPAFESYGLTGNNNSAVCTHCAKAYVESLNWLLSNGKEQQQPDDKKPHFVYSNRKKISEDSAFVFWLKNGIETELLDLLETPTEDAIRKLLSSPEAPRHFQEVDGNTFYGFTLSGAAARIAVRDWIQFSLPDVQRSIRKWFQDIAIFDSVTKDGKTTYVGIRQMIYACRRKGDSSDDVAGRIGTTLWNSAIKGARIPLWVLSTVIGRLKAEQGDVTVARAALIKLWLKRSGNSDFTEHSMEELEKSNQDTPYLCGRLFAVLERLQYHAQGEVNAGISERFYTAASCTPATAFARLLKLSKQHLSKLRGQKPGLAVNLDKEIQEILAPVNSFPATFRLEEQGMFALGYFHQKRSRREQFNVLANEGEVNGSSN